MASAKCDTSQEGPFFALDPVVVSDIVSVGPEWVQTKEWEGIDMRPEGT